MRSRDPPVEVIVICGPRRSGRTTAMRTLLNEQYGVFEWSSAFLRPGQDRVELLGYWGVIVEHSETLALEVVGSEIPVSPQTLAPWVSAGAVPCQTGVRSFRRLILHSTENAAHWVDKEYSSWISAVYVMQQGQLVNVH